MGLCVGKKSRAKILGEAMSIHVIGGGTFNHVRTHLSLATPAFGTLAKQIVEEIDGKTDLPVHLHMTRMADPTSSLETNQDVQDLVDSLCEDPETKMIFMTAAICDFDGAVNEPFGVPVPSGKYAPRLKSSEDHIMVLTRADKILGRIRSKHAKNPRKDIFLVSCKTTDGISDQEMVLAGIRSMKESSCNLVLVNDVKRRKSCIVTPEQAVYSFSEDRRVVVRNLVDIALSRRTGRFVRTRVEEGSLHALVRAPRTFREVVEYLVENGAFKDIVGNGKTVGHFAHVPGGTYQGALYSSRRHVDFTDRGGTDLVGVVESQEGVVAYGAKPSAGVRSQMRLFKDHPQYNAVVHFHCPLRPGASASIREQRNYECGSIECGLNTSNGIETVTLESGHRIGVVMLAQHGPNILFNTRTGPDEIVDFIHKTFDLSKHTGEV